MMTKIESRKLKGKKEGMETNKNGNKEKKKKDRDKN